MLIELQLSDAILEPGEQGQQCNSPAVWFRINIGPWHRSEFKSLIHAEDAIFACLSWSAPLKRLPDRQQWPNVSAAALIEKINELVDSINKMGSKEAK